MELPPLLLQTAGSLVAILALAGLAWWLRLGGAPMLADEQAIRRIAGEVDDGFVPASSTLSDDGAAALARDSSGRIMVIRRHGNRFAGRVLGPEARAVIWRDPGAAAGLEVDCGEAHFGKVFLTIPDAEAWATAINALNAGHDA